MSFETIDPTSGTLLRRYERTGADELEERLARAVAAQERWSREPVSARAAVLSRAAEVLLEGREELALLATEEMGKPLAEARAEVEKCAQVCEYYARNAEGFLADRPVATEFSASYVAHLPLGCVLAIMPWNFPYWQVFRFGAPALAAGNAVLLKPAPSVCGTGEAIESVLDRAGLPAGLFANLRLEEERVAELIARPEIAAVTLTGSTRAGRAVASLAGAALKKCVLELGGSDPYVVLPDADLEVALDACVTGRFLNGGQSCIAAKRLIVCAPRVEELVAGLRERVAALPGGDPRDPSTRLGPLAREDLRAALHAQVTSSVAAGARLLAGGVLPEGPGWFYPATVLADVAPGMAAFDEELFGPVACVVPARDEADALRLAGATRYGLGAAVFTRDVARGERIARRELCAGAAFVNAFVRSDPRLPFGGVRESGYGRELSREGILEFVNAKTIVVR